MQYNISDSQALFWCSVLIILKMASLDTLFLCSAGQTASLALLLACSYIFCQNQGFCSYKIVLIKKSVKILHPDEKRPTLIFLEMFSNCKTGSCLFHIFFKEAANQSSLKKVNPNKFPNILKIICTWIHSSKPAKLRKITLFENPAYNITIYSANYKRLNLVGCFSHK